MRFMSISMNLNNSIPELIRMYMPLFVSFKHVYLFGSVLNSDLPHNDIDILVIYTEYSSKIGNDLRLISDELAKASELPIDLTALSVEEEKDTAFLEKIKPHYLKLK